MAHGVGGRIHRRDFTAANGWGRWHKVPELHTRFRMGPYLLAVGSSRLLLFGRDADGRAVSANWNGRRPAGDQWTLVRPISR